MFLDWLKGFVTQTSHYWLQIVVIRLYRFKLYASLPCNSQLCSLCNFQLFTDLLTHMWLRDMPALSGKTTLSNCFYVPSEKGSPLKGMNLLRYWEQIHSF